MSKKSKSQDVSAKKAEVIELLNKLATLTKEIEKPREVEDYDGRTQYLTTEYFESYLADDYPDDDTAEDVEFPTDSEGEDIKKADITEATDEQVFLYCVGQYAERCLNGDTSSASYNEQKYYDSTCW